MTLTPSTPEQPTPSGCPFPFAPPADPLELPDEYARLHQQAPVTRVKLPPGQADEYGWIATGYEEALRVYQDDETFSRAQGDGVAPGLKAHPIIVALDGDEHREKRGLAQGEFSPAKMRKRRGLVEELAEAQLEEMLAKGEPADLVADFAMPLTLHVLGSLFDIPREDYPKFRGWAEALVTVDPGQPERAVQVMGAMTAYVAELMPARAANPGDDLVSAIALKAQQQGVDIMDAGLVAVSLVTGGWESTGGQMVSSIHKLLTTTGPDGTSLYSALCADPDLIPTAVEEMFRVVPNSVLGTTQPRRATRDVELGGVLIRAGEVVFPSPDAANRDPARFTDPDVIDLTRKPNPHIAFGNGPHVCIGAPLGRLEIESALRLLTRRLPALRLAVPAEDLVWPFGSRVIRYPDSYPVAWSPAAV